MKQWRYVVVVNWTFWTAGRILVDFVQATCAAYLTNLVLIYAVMKLKNGQNYQREKILRLIGRLYVHHSEAWNEHPSGELAATGIVLPDVNICCNSKILKIFRVNNNT